MYLILSSDKLNPFYLNLKQTLKYKFYIKYIKNFIQQVKHLNIQTNYTKTTNKF
jgi:hypothetical protein